MTQQIGLSIEKTRIYFTGNTYPHKDRLKSFCGWKNWDGYRKQWFCGKAKLDAAKELVDKLNGATGEPKTEDCGKAKLDAAKELVDKLNGATGEPKTEDSSDVKIIGKASYKGREYYVRFVGECKSGEYKARLTTLDGKLDFWAVCARPGYRAGQGEAAIIKTYQEPKTLASLARFVAEKKAEREEEKVQAKAVATAAHGEPMRQIRNVTDARIIRAFFGDRAVAYDYTVTHADFDEYDNEGPGRYCGVSVPASLADKWDAGISAAKAAGVESRSRAGLTLRWAAMAGEGQPLPAALEEVAAEREAKDSAAAAKKAEQEAAAAKLAADKAAMLDGLVQSSVGPDAGECTFDRNSAAIRDGNSTYSVGTIADGRRIVRHDISNYDDYRTYYYAPADVARAWALAWANQRGITVERAREWLSQYGGCHGADLYRAVVDEAETTATATSV